MVETKGRTTTTKSTSSSSFRKKSAAAGGFNLRPKTKTLNKGNTFEPRNAKGFKNKFNSNSEIDLIDDSKGKGFEKRGFENKGFERKANFKNQSNATHSNKFSGPVKFGRNNFDDKNRTRNKENSFEFRGEDGVIIKGYKSKNNAKGDVEVDSGGGGKGVVNKGFESKNSFKNQFEGNQDRPVRFGRNRSQEKYKTSVDDDLEDRPKKKKKRGIRLDPYDISSKRMDDSAPTATG